LYLGRGRRQSTSSWSSTHRCVWVDTNSCYRMEPPAYQHPRLQQLRSASWQVPETIAVCVMGTWLQGNIVLTDDKYEVLTLLRSHRDDDKVGRWGRVQERVVTGSTSSTEPITCNLAGFTDTQVLPRQALRCNGSERACELLLLPVLRVHLFTQGFAVMARHPYPMQHVRLRRSIPLPELTAAYEAAADGETIKGRCQQKECCNSHNHTRHVQGGAAGPSAERPSL
jgi:hypothetical protein